MFKIIKFIKIIPLVLVGVGITTIAYGGDLKAGSGAMPEVGAFDALSPGNKKIAEALFNGQIVTADGKAPLSLDLIAASKQRDGWGRIFRELKADGLIEAKNLGELMSSRNGRGIAGNGTRSIGRSRATVVTTAGGRQIIVGKKSAVRQARVKRASEINRRGKYTDQILSSGSTYRGRLDYDGESVNASSLGIATAKGVGTSNFIASKPNLGKK